MAVYKVIQDIEAEDKLLGPLTLKQFIFALISAGFIFIAFMLVSKTGIIYLAIPFLPFILAFGVLAAPLSKDQPTDLWLAARIRFFIKPRKRIWDQTGLKELVTITVPKKEIKVFTDNLSQGEVKSRLEALANTLDSRGWALKNVAVNMYANPSFAYAYDGGQERLLDPRSLPQAAEDIVVNQADDILDAYSNPAAQHLDQMVQASTASHKAQAKQYMQQAIQASHIQQSTTDVTNDAFAVQTPDGDTYTVEAPPQELSSSFDQPAIVPDYSFINQATTDRQPVEPNSVAFKEQIVTANSQPFKPNNQSAQPQTDNSIDEEAILEQIHRQQNQTNASNPHHKVVKTTEQLAEEAEARQKIELVEKQIEADRNQAMTAQPNPVNIELAQSDDLSVDTISKLANRKPKQADGEVVVNLR